MKNLLKKFTTIILICLSVSFVATIALPEAVSAEAFAGRTGSDCPNFLGLTSWDCGVSISDEDSLKSGIWQIVLNISIDLARLAAYLVIGYVIYGGYLYVFSGGDPGKVAAGKKTLTQAFIGLAIVMSADAIMSTIRFALLGSQNLSNCAETECIDPGLLFINTVHWFIAVVGIVSLIFVIYGGITYMTSTGDPGKVKKGRDMIMYALIGLVIVALAEVITAFVSNAIREANKNAYINNTFISKEVHENNKLT